ncbi:hypothetical protein A4A49_55446 [Nicotiana attenuata]|uniref:Uncharacterized protein n=1 Tax=Nicotiana attenuata TaxID=49451 RepID=A0A1J6KCA8_NICAT|nr:hypothetical protein A4A49_55446 [Nicotiana attenuata]
MSMSNLDLFHVKEDEKNIKSDNDSRLPTLKDPNKYTDIAPEDQQVFDQKQDENNPEKGRLCSGQSEVPNDDEGFTTPTSSDQKIPEMTTCPPAPKKLLSTKRRASLSTSINPTLQIDLESNFTTIIHEDTERNIKKLRKQDGDE